MSTVTDEQHAKNISADAQTGVKCLIDAVWVHSIPTYLAWAHPDISLANYQALYPDAPILSKRLQEASAARDKVQNVTKLNLPLRTPAEPIKKPFADVFELGAAPAALNKRGQPIMISVLEAHGEFKDFVPKIDPNYIFNIDLLKTAMMAVELTEPMLAWGLHGTGKTSLIEQYCARTGRPWLRVQHTIDTESAHILGQFILRGQETVFNPGPLAVAMRYGLVYCADEYDFGLPSVLAVYQPVLEGKALVIKEACPEWRIVEPHPDFRFFATGNTNGGGDETGLYQGTQLQNAANYSRFTITEQVNYMEPKQEVGVVESQGGIHTEDSERLVKLGGLVRAGYMQGDLGVTVSPRELINAAKLGRVLGGDWKKGLALAYTNRLNTTDRAAVLALMQRVFPV